MTDLDDCLRWLTRLDDSDGLQVKLCSSKDEAIKEWAVKAIGALAEATGFDVGLMREAICEGTEMHGDMASDVALAKYYGDTGNQRRAADKLAKLASSHDAHPQLVSQGGVRELITLAFSHDEHVQRR